MYICVILYHGWFHKCFNTLNLRQWNFDIWDWFYIDALTSGPRLDLDPDIVAAMDEDFDFEDPDNELEENFIELANAEDSGSEMRSDVSHGDDDK